MKYVNRWDDGENRHRSVAQTLVVCDKHCEDGSVSVVHPLKLYGDIVLDDEEYFSLRKYAAEVFM